MYIIIRSNSFGKIFQLMIFLLNTKKNDVGLGESERERIE